MSVQTPPVSPVNKAMTPPILRVGTPSTYHASLQRSVTAYQNTLSALGSFFDMTKWESSVPQDLSHAEKKDLFQWDYSANYPPCLKAIPPQDAQSPLQIFNFTAFIQTFLIILNTLPDVIDELAPDALTDKTMQSLVDRNAELHSGSQNMYYNKNVGDRDDWYTDAVLGQQQFTGVNPTTIALATHWVEEFRGVANAQDRTDIVELLEGSPASEFFVQDYSYFRSVIGVPADSDITTDGRYCCASVALFHLEPQGYKLHPLAITIDYKGSMEESVTIFNRRVTSDSTIPEASDWPWRYAKMCSQVSDWQYHEIAVHLVHTHLLEEAIIVAAHRSFVDPNHIVFKLLEPHWNITLSLNALARSTLVPNVVAKIVGFTPDQTYAFGNDVYNRFDWISSYVPNNLEKRGFPVKNLDDPQFHNYGYARNIYRVWNILRTFVATILKAEYTNDAHVAGDTTLKAFCTEMRDGAKLASFPAAINTLDELIDVVTMCIHIASPQHTAVNYLQQYYQTFVPNKPSALYAPLPQSLQALEQITEADIMAALPVDQPQQWLLQAQLPYLLSFPVAEDNNILWYAWDTYLRYYFNTTIRDAADTLRKDLENFAITVAQLSDELDDHKTPYLVLDPHKTASSIVI